MHCNSVATRAWARKECHISGTCLLINLNSDIEEIHNIYVQHSRTFL